MDITIVPADEFPDASIGAYEQKVLLNKPPSLALEKVKRIATISTINQ